MIPYKGLLKDTDFSRQYPEFCEKTINNKGNDTEREENNKTEGDTR